MDKIQNKQQTTNNRHNNMSNTDTNMTRKNKQWLRNRNQRKNPKIFSAKFIQNPDGSFELIGGQSLVAMRSNQHSVKWVNVNTRDFACELRNNRLIAL